VTHKNDSTTPINPIQIPLQSVDAGEFGQWLLGSDATQVNGADADVPCGTCNGCCKSFYFIHITPDDKKALKAIPEPLLFAAPGLPEGHFVMGYNKHGHCPMLIDDRCSIYFERPQTCRAYDCRIFSAAGMEPGETDKALVSERTQHWAFSYASEKNRQQHAAVQTAAAWLRSAQQDTNSKLPEGFIPSNSTQLAVLALQIHSLFATSQEPVDTTTQEFANRAVALAPRPV
jgi:Fe-S-cluster containining protein